jgi:hypothetical protein
MIYTVFSAILYQAIFENKIDPMPLRIPQAAINKQTNK